MGAGASLPVRAYDEAWFDEFYDRALPVVFGYLLRLCGGDRTWYSQVLCNAMIRSS